jgi:hypothetical protein
MAKGNISALLSGIVGAVLNEQLRSMPPVVAIPKQVSKHQDQIIVVDGKRSTLPAGAHMSLNVVGIHRNLNTGQRSARKLQMMHMTLTISGQKDSWLRVHQMEHSLLTVQQNQRTAKISEGPLERTLLCNSSVLRHDPISPSLIVRDLSWEGDWLK